MNPKHLLDMAKLLVDPPVSVRGAPRQMNLRRAVSDAYYALFHAVSADVERSWPGESRLKKALRRAVNHRDLRTASERFRQKEANGKNGAVKNGWLTAISPELDLVANTVVDLQNFRHKADYDPDYRLSRNEARDIVLSAVEAVEALGSLRNRTEYGWYLAGVLIGPDRLKRG